MATRDTLRLVEPAEGGISQAFRADVLGGLSRPQKAVPARWFYDDAGSRLFEDITRLPEYYPTRAETEILSTRAGAIAALVGTGRAVVELGSGSSVKTPLLLEAIAPSAYVPLDIAGGFLRESAAALARRFPGLAVHPVEADFTRPFVLPVQTRGLPLLCFFPGSTIGNMSAAAAVDLLRALRDRLGDEALLLMGMDLIKDEAELIAAYDDAAGVTAQFNLNLLRRINRELGGTIPVDAFRHRARWNEVHARIEMHLEAMRPVRFTVEGQAFAMRAGETIHTENSHKFSARSQNLLLLAGSWLPLARWTDAAGRFSLVLARAAAPEAAP